MSDNRNGGRARAMLGAQIIFNNRNSTMNCQIRNLSPKGARLAFADTVSVPEEFELYVPQKGRSYRARMRWRDSDGAGVEFIGEGVAEVQHNAADAPRRVAELEAENAALRLKVMELTRRLESRGGTADQAA